MSDLNQRLPRPLKLGDVRPPPLKFLATCASERLARWCRSRGLLPEKQARPTQLTCFPHELKFKLRRRRTYLLHHVLFVEIVKGSKDFFFFCFNVFLDLEAGGGICKCSIIRVMELLLHHIFFIIINSSDRCLALYFFFFLKPELPLLFKYKKNKDEAATTPHILLC